MIHAGEKNIKQAWRQSLRQLYDDGVENSLRDYYRVSPALIEVEDTQDEHYDDLYHFPVSEIREGNRYLVTGESADGGQYEDELGKVYRERLFGESADEDEGQNQIDAVVQYLQENPAGQNALISLWQAEDMEAETSPLVQSLSFHIEDGELCLHVHAREQDGYRGLLPDMSRFATLQHYVADRLRMSPGEFCYFVDALHFKNDDKEHVDLLLAP
ncbi:thymidylate synthase [bacterium]|nr:thymidylate synthase [bacterium]